MRHRAAEEKLLKSIALPSCIAGLLAVLILFLSPPHAPLYLLSSEREIPLLEWDTGYGFNRWQAISQIRAEEHELIQGRPAYLLRQFSRLTSLKSIKLCSSKKPEVFLRIGYEILQLREATKQAGGCQKFPVPRNALSAGNRSWLHLGLGCLLFALLAFYWIRFLSLSQPAGANGSPSQFWQVLGLLFLLGIATAAILIYPWQPNPFEPLIIFEGLPGTSYSEIVRWLWLSLAEVAPRRISVQFFVGACQMAAFGLLTLTLLREILPAGGGRIQGIVGMAILVFLLNPLQLNAQFFLSRSYLASHVNFLFWLNSFLLLYRKKHAPPWCALSIWLFAIGAAMVRFDIIPFIFLAAVFLGSRIKEKRLTLLSIGPTSLIAVLLVSGFTEPDRPLREELIYAQSQVIHILEKISTEGPIPPRCLATEKSASLHSIWSRLTCVSDQPLSYGIALAKFLKEVLFGETPKNFYLPWQELQTIQRLMDTRLLDLDPLVPPSFLEHLDDLTWPANTLIPVLLMVLAIRLYNHSPATASVSALILSRFLFLIVVSPTHNFHYFYEIHLWGWFTIIGMAVEMGLLGRAAPSSKAELPAPRPRA